jgi:hypothetical protein
MSVIRSTHANDVAARLAAWIRAESAVRELWAREYGAAVELWIIADNLDVTQERGLYTTIAHLMEDFPDYCIQAHLLDSQKFEEGAALRDLLPAGVELIPLDKA